MTGNGDRRSSIESERNFTEKSDNLKRDRLKFKWGRGFFENNVIKLRILVV